MSANTKIEWCDHTFNPWIGCTKVSPGCDHCYAEKNTPVRVMRASGVETWGPGAPRRRTSDYNWGLPLKWDRQAEAAQSAWESGVKVVGGGDEAELLSRGFVKPRRPRVFCASLADVFDNEVPAEWRRDLFNLILSTPHLDWLLLTKRIGNAARMIDEVLPDDMKSLPADHPVAWPWANVWIGATVVNQAEADRDIPKLLAVPAARRFLSIEPMLGPINLEQACDIAEQEQCKGTWREMADPQRCLMAFRHGSVAMLDWVICGGESGPHARPMHPDWVRSLRDQCAAAGVPFLFKQWGEFFPKSNHTGLSDSSVNPNLMIRIGKKSAGRLLDGREHNEFPEAP